MPRAEAETVVAEFARLSAECDAREKAWREAHKNDPCERCGNLAEVEIIPTGNLARLTPLCRKCREYATLETRLHHKGWNVGYAMGWRSAMQQPWWKRLWGPKEYPKA